MGSGAKRQDASKAQKITLDSDINLGSSKNPNKAEASVKL